MSDWPCKAGRSHPSRLRRQSRGRQRRVDLFCDSLRAGRLQARLQSAGPVQVPVASGQRPGHPVPHLVETLHRAVFNFRHGKAFGSVNLENAQVHILEIAVLASTLSPGNVEGVSAGLAVGCASVRAVVAGRDLLETLLLTCLEE